MTLSRPPPGHFTVLYFATATSYTAKSNEHFPAPLRARDLFAKLEERYPGIAEKVLSSSAVTVNLEYIDVDIEGEDGTQDGVVINAGDEVAIIPPVSSG